MQLRSFGGVGGVLGGARFGGGRRRWSLLTMAIGPIAAASWGSACFAQSVTWDASGANAASPTDGSGSWDTTAAANWSDGSSDTAWITGDVANIGNGGTAGTITIDDSSGTVNASGINFNPVGSGSYTIAASSGDTLTLNGTTPTITLAGADAMINAPIAGTVGMVVAGSGNALTLGGVNTYTGTTIIEETTTATASSGANVTLGSGASLGTASDTMYVGYNAAATAGSGNVDTSSLTLNGAALTVGTLNIDYISKGISVGTGAGNTLTMNGASTLNTDNIVLVSGVHGSNTKGGNASLTLGSGATLSLNGSAGSGAVTTLDIADYNYETGGSTGTGIIGVVDFSAGTVNGTITTVDVGSGKAGSGTTSGDAGPANGTLSFANGSLNIGTLNIARMGSENAVGTVNLVTGGTGTMTVGTGLGSTAITFGATGNGTQNTKNTLSSGIVNINGASLAVDGNIVANPGGSADYTTSTATINLNGGALNLMGNSIGSAITAVAPSTANLAGSATLSNVASINGTGGLTMSGSGTLNLTGANAWTGATAANSGTTVLTSGSSLGDTAIAIASGATFTAQHGATAGSSPNTSSTGATVTLNAGATLSMVDNAIGTFTVNQGSAFTGTALALDGGTIDFDLGISGPDQLLVGVGDIDVEGTNTIDLSLVSGTTMLTPGEYPLLTTDGSVTGSGSFVFANDTNTETISAGSNSYTLTLDDPQSAEVLSISSGAVPEPASLGLLAIATSSLLVRRRGRSSPDSSVAAQGRDGV